MPRLAGAQVSGHGAFAERTLAKGTGACRCLSGHDVSFPGAKCYQPDTIRHTIPAAVYGVRFQDTRANRIPHSRRVAARGAAGNALVRRMPGRAAWDGPTPGAGASGSRVAGGGWTRAVEKAV